ncbi:uncharacterized protein LOC123290959 [Chrysoperla carnea]|uniref:uncharacterized protein LOC123290959 n=1 Tax=Chrysoperla carnea TaxID=189513 RepID=UPI001D075A09|nr:uncharacterized protein LOC123290959 [Chrysoperla carnea]
MDAHTAAIKLLINNNNNYDYQQQSNVAAGVGCLKCTEQEIRYCLGPSLINDHCCCDRRFIEMFSYIPHTCYIGSTNNLCSTIARDCGEYARLRACCCLKYTTIKYKALFSSSNNINNNNNNSHILLLMIFIINVLLY